MEAYGRPGTYVTRDWVMQRAYMADIEHFSTIAKYLKQQKGGIAEADVVYGVFVETASRVHV